MFLFAILKGCPGGEIDSQRNNKGGEIKMAAGRMEYMRIDFCCRQLCESSPPLLSDIRRRPVFATLSTISLDSLLNEDSVSSYYF